MPYSKHSEKAFTLAELLIALAILGVIAAFSIPKVLQAQQDQKKKAVFKEIIGAVNAALYEGVVSGQLVRTPTLGNNADYFRSKLNAVKICTNAGADGCWSHTTFSATNLSEYGVIMHNGATVAGFTNYTGSFTWEGREDFIIDWNGPAGANTEGDDQIHLELCINASPGNCAGSKSGKIYPWSTTSETLWVQIFN